MSEFAARIEAVRSRLIEGGLDGALIAATDHMRYLVGWSEPPGERFMALWLPTVGRPEFIVPGLYADDVRARAAAVDSLRVWHDSEGWHGIARTLLRSSGRYVVDDDLAAVHLLDLQAIAPSSTWQPLGPIMSVLRASKSEAEVAQMRRSAHVADEVYEDVLKVLEPGVTEAAMTRYIVDRFCSLGATSAWAIVCFGENSALPHHRPGDRALRSGDVVILDLGGCLDGYQSDITRTIAFGDRHPEASAIYDVVYEAHAAAQSAAVLGATCEDVDRAARAVIERAGYGPRFVHRTGHGIGLSTHEPPYIVAGNRQTLAVGMCFSDEPGIYLTGRFGVRIENILTIGAGGAYSLNAAPPSRLLVRRAQD